ncbi:hypothetical protein KKH27_02410 [bacterium]|nr:hypothetical protein [bacterium]
MVKAFFGEPLDYWRRTNEVARRGRTELIALNRQQANPDRDRRIFVLEEGLRVYDNFINQQVARVENALSNPNALIDGNILQNLILAFYEWANATLDEDHELRQRLRMLNDLG